MFKKRTLPRYNKLNKNPGFVSDVIVLEDSSSSSKKIKDVSKDELSPETFLKDQKRPSTSKNLSPETYEEIDLQCYEYNKQPPSSPIVSTTTKFNHFEHHPISCPSVNNKASSLQFYTRHHILGLPKPKNYLIWYNISISTGQRAQKLTCCVNFNINTTLIVGSTNVQKISKNDLSDKVNITNWKVSPFHGSKLEALLTSHEAPACCGVRYINQFETVGNKDFHLYLDTITPVNKIPITPEFIKPLFAKLYQVSLSVFEELYPDNVVLGAHNLILKGRDVDANKLFDRFIKKLEEEYNFYYYKSVDGQTFQEGGFDEAVFTFHSNSLPPEPRNSLQSDKPVTQINQLEQRLLNSTTPPLPEYENVEQWLNSLLNNS